MPPSIAASRKQGMNPKRRNLSVKVISPCRQVAGRNARSFIPRGISFASVGDITVCDK